MGAYFLKKQARSPILEGFGRNIYALLSFSGQQYNYIDDFALATWAPIQKENEYKLDVFVDKCSVEIFLDGGKIAMTNLIFPTEPYNRMCFYSKGGTFAVDSFSVYRLGL